MSSKQDNEIFLILYVPILWSLLWILFIECLIHLLFNKMSLYSLWLIVVTTFLFTPFAFLCSLLSTKNEYIFGFNPTNSSITTPLVSSFIFMLGTYLNMSLFLSVRLSVCRAPYLRNRTSSNHNFWYTCVNWWYLQVFFFIFLKMKMKNNNYICHVPYLRNSIPYDHDFWYCCVKWWYLQVFFSFSKFWFFGLLGR